MARASHVVPAGAVLLAISIVSVVGAARADEPTAKCAVRLIQASNEPARAGDGIDPQIAQLRAYLTRAPFSAWKQFKLLEQRELTIAPHAVAPFPMPNGRQGALTYVEHVLRPDGKHRLRLELGITDGSKQLLHTTFVLDEGGVVLHAAQKHDNNGLLILAISCETH